MNLFPERLKEGQGPLPISIDAEVGRAKGPSSQPNFQIIELNGAASEVTNIYDSRNSLWSAYATLFRQWRIVYAIGAANRRRGFQPASPYAVWRDWREYTSQACGFPLAD